ncbi:MAG TPA: response regulator [Patescibacteria group bacterium]|nr:response regulator [Patescibacteria group bacterium]
MRSSRLPPGQLVTRARLPKPWHRLSPLQNRLYAAGAALFLFGATTIGRAADPYATALDNRFSNGTDSSEHLRPEVAALEQGLKEQVRQLSQPPQVKEPEPAGPDGKTTWLLGAGFSMVAIVVGLGGVLALRRWNRWLEEQEASRNQAATIMMEDAWIAELRQALQETPANTEAPSPLSRVQSLIGERLAATRAGLTRLSATSDAVEASKLLLELGSSIESVKKESEAAELRSVRLLASALEGLLAQLATKPSNATPSALRTALGAVDLLEFLITRTLRQDLATNPPVRLLVVDDEPISRRAVTFALKKVFADPDLAPDGRIGLGLADRNAYDLILLDVEMPGLDGFELCSRIHQTAPNCATPVVFVTNHSDFESRAKCALSGGHDLMAKPFLAFEITVKALTLVLKGRAERETGDQAQSSESQVDGTLENAATSPKPPAARQASAPAANGHSRHVLEPSSKRSTEVTELAQRFNPPGIDSSTTTPQAPGLEWPNSRPQPADELTRAFFEAAPADLRALREQLISLVEAHSSVERDEVLGGLFIAVHSLSGDAGRVQLDTIFRVASALEVMLKKLLSQPTLCTPSAMETIAGAFEALDQLCLSSEDLDLGKDPPRLLVVDDDPVARRAMEASLQLGFGRPDTADCGEAALTRAKEKSYDLIFLDVMMPGMDGFAVCKELHGLGSNRRTPVVFVTSKDDGRSRAEADASGGSGFIAKPVLPWQIKLLALTHVVRCRLASADNAQAATARRQLPEAPNTQPSSRIPVELHPLV